jgi:hypothetical protein
MNDQRDDTFNTDGGAGFQQAVLRARASVSASGDKTEYDVCMSESSHVAGHPIYTQRSFQKLIVACLVGKFELQSRRASCGFRLPIGDPSAEPDESLHDYLGIGSVFEPQCEFDRQWQALVANATTKQGVCHDRQSPKTLESERKGTVRQVDTCL